MSGFTQVLSGTCQLQSLSVLPPVKTGQNSTSNHCEHMVTLQEQNRQQSGCNTVFRVHRYPVHTGFGVVHQLMLGDQVSCIKRASF